MSGIIQGLLASLQSAVAAVTDQYFNLVTLLLNTTSTNGAQNNTFLDESSNAFTITRNGNATQGTFTPFSQTGWSNYFGGAGNSLTTNAGACPSSTTSFTLEGFFYTTVTGTEQAIVCRDNNLSGFYLRINSSNKLELVNINNAVILTGTTSVTPNVWNYFCLTRSGNTFTIYLNAVSDGTTSNAVSFTATGNTLIGSYYTGGVSFGFNGYLSNIRFVSGTATAPSGVPTSPLTAVAGTALLTCQGNRFLDASSNAYTVSINAGSPSVQAFSPFAPTGAYSAATVGGSGYFDGAGDYLSIASNAAFGFGTGNYTMEAWIYSTVSISSNTAIFDFRNSTPAAGQPNLYISSAAKAVFYLEGSSNLITGTTTISPNTWYHIAVSKSSGVYTLYVNGVSQGTATNSVSVPTSPVRLGIDYAGSSAFTGYISSVRITNTAVYTAAFTPPTVPVTAITGTQVLLNFTNAGIYDAAAKNDLETVGNAQVSTTQAKFGTTSMYFDGTDDRLPFPSAPYISFGTGDFTIEFWLNSNNVSSANTPGVFQTSDTAGGLKTTYTSGICLFQGSTATGSGANGALCANVIGTSVGSNAGGSITTGTWYHIALVRYNGVVTMYLNGTALPVTATISGAISGTYLVVGGYYSTSYLYNGYLDEFRITKYARYTSNFSVPTTAFPVQ